jgi:hypothetical protein
MRELTCTGKERCQVCGCADYREAHFTAGRLVCLACWREIERHRGQVTAGARIVQPGACSAARRGMP